MKQLLNVMVVVTLMAFNAIAQNDWGNQSVLQVNTEKAHATMMAYPDVTKAYQ